MPHKVLISIENKDIAQVMLTSLRREGLEVQVHASKPHAIGHITHSKPDIVITDSRSNYEVLTTAIGQQIPVIVADDESKSREAHDMGASLFVTMPDQVVQMGYLTKTELQY